MSFASVSTVAVSLLVLGMFLLIFLNTNNLAKYLESQVQITVYMQDNANDKDLEAMSGKLKALPGVVSVKQVKKAEALNRFKERLGEQENLLSALGTENPFPNSFEVQVDVPERIKEIAPTIHQMPKVETAKFGQEVVEALMDGEVLARLSGLRVLHIGDSFFINSERLETVDPVAADALCRYTIISKDEFGAALENPAFAEELTGLINQGYWYFDK